ncbi:MAG: hypothetical protein K5987_03285 [Lachnospiraceae bacterium]|nr:hypothetical protein [Lachnospiraceae bacterium]
MTKLEKNILKKTEERLPLIFFLGISICGFLLRYFMRNISASHDTADFIKWYGRIVEAGGLFHMGEAKMGYSAMYKLALTFMTYLPLEPIYAVKLLSGSFDYVLALAAAWITYLVSTGEKGNFFAYIKNIFTAKENKADVSLMVYALVLCSPVCALNSAAWGQCDSIYAAFIMLSIGQLIRERNISSFVLLGFAFSFKLQAVFILPFFVFYWFYKKSFSVLHFLEVPAVFFLTSLPNTLTGGDAGRAVTTYSRQTSVTTQMYSRYPSFWCFLTDEHAGDFEDFYRYRLFAMVFCVVVLACIMYAFIKKIKYMNMENTVSAAFILSYATVLFLPSMLERYGYVYEMLAIVAAARDKRYIIPAAALHVLTLYEYGDSLGRAMLPVPLAFVSWINIILFAYCLIAFMKRQDNPS